jgi:hypothetical protein
LEGELVAMSEPINVRQRRLWLSYIAREDDDSDFRCMALDQIARFDPDLEWRAFASRCLQREIEERV